MKKKSYWRSKVIFIIIIAALFILIFMGFRIWYGKTAEAKAYLSEQVEYYNYIAKTELKWIADSQLSNGALPFRRGDRDDEVRIVPYFSCVAARALLNDSEYYDSVARYIRWHCMRINNAGEDSNGLAGTINDYYATIRSGRVVSQRSSEHYDSVDSYAALFLIVLWEYYEKTGDKDLLIEYESQWHSVIKALEEMIDEDGLSFVKPDYKIKYLMDNAEVYQGLDYAVRLMEALYSGDEAKKQEQWIKELKERHRYMGEQIEALLWNESENRYETGIDNEGNRLDFSGWDVFYVDAVCQLMPIIFGVIKAGAERSNVLFQTFSNYYKWEELDYLSQTTFYWGLTVYTGALMGEDEKVLSYIRYYEEHILEKGHKYPLYNGDAAWVAAGCTLMVERYGEALKEIDPLNIVKGFKSNGGAEK